MADQIVWCTSCGERVAVSDAEPLCSLCSSEDAPEDAAPEPIKVGDMIACPMCEEDIEVRVIGPFFAEAFCATCDDIQYVYPDDAIRV